MSLSGPDHIPPAQLFRIAGDDGDSDLLAALSSTAQGFPTGTRSRARVDYLTDHKPCLFHPGTLDVEYTITCELPSEKA